jgi:hypothetical protein
VLIILLGDNNKSKKIGEKVRQNYRQEISGIVSSVSQNRGTIKLQLKDEANKPYYFGVTRNYKLCPYDLDDFLQSGDSVYKASNSNDFFVFREGNKYRFVLDKRINK